MDWENTMEKITLNDELSLPVPEGFHTLTEEERGKMKMLQHRRHKEQDDRRNAGTGFVVHLYRLRYRYACGILRHEV